MSSRAPVEPPQSPTSPFLHNLHQRLRKGSTASRASSLSSETTQGPVEPPIVQDTRSTKKYLLSILRDDWEYPVTQEQAPDPKTAREASDYRLRDESVSEYETNGSSGTRRKSEDVYKFDNPDDVGTVIEKRRARKRRLLEQEMTWNDGLRTWTLRRDAWVGAVPHKPGSMSMPKENELLEETSDPNNVKPGGSNEQHEPISGNGRAEDNAMATTEPDVVDKDEQGEQDLPDGPYLPIYPPLFSPSHTLRSRIKPSAYPTLYSKVVLQSLAPNVPIPLNHMINALVDGWKSEGNWPPQPLAAQGLAAHRRSRKGESAFQKWKREQDEKRQAAAGIQYELEEPEHKSVRKSLTGVVKKAFGRKEPEQENVEQDLERLGLTFESDDAIQEAELDAAYAIGHG